MNLPVDYIIAKNTVGKDGNGIRQVTIHPDSGLLKEMLKSANLKSKEELEERYHIKVWEVKHG